MHAIDSPTVDRDRGPAPLPRRSFFGRLLLIGAGASLLPAALRAALKRSALPEVTPKGNGVRVQIHPGAVPRTSKGLNG